MTIHIAGANYFNQTPSDNWFTEAKAAGIEFARVAPDKWKGEQRDFLIGNADAFTAISTKDLKTLREVFDQAQRVNMKVVLTLLSLPGSRWRQNNQDQDDLRLWKQKEYREQACRCWKSLAKELKDHPAIVGYNVLNEPHPELLSGEEDYREIDFQAWYGAVKDTLADLNSFYSELVGAIREVDGSTPIVLDTGLYATPWAISYLAPLEDKQVLYSFHMYEPYAYTTRRINQGRFTFPGPIPLKLEDAKKDASSSSALSFVWNLDSLKHFLKPISDWQQQHQISSSRILVGEFGCDRTSTGAEAYFASLIQIFDSLNWHWAFYCFREDRWEGMDYELGSEKISDEYWNAVGQGASLAPFRKDNPLFDVIKQNLRKF